MTDNSTTDPAGDMLVEAFGAMGIKVVDATMVPGHSDFNCPVCNAISLDYCQLRQCRWDVIDPKGSGVSRGKIISGQ